MVTRRFRLTQEAERDFDGIGEYTLEQWGEAQAYRYLAALDAAFHRISEERSLGRRRDDLRPGLWSQRHGSHIVFFRRDGDGNVDVLRILHKAQDPARHLSK